MPNKYWNATVSLLNVSIPNIHVIPSNGNSTMADWTPDLAGVKSKSYSYQKITSPIISSSFESVFAYQ